MRINSQLIKEAVDIASEGIDSANLGLVANSNLPDMLSFIDSEKFIAQAEENKNITALFITAALSAKITRKNINKIIVDDPRHAYYSLYNFIAEKNYKKSPSVIDSSAKVHPKAFVSEYNVTIGKNCVIEPNVTILPDVIIGDNCYIMAGAVLGSSGFEYKRTSKGVLPVIHDGKVILHDYAEIGANTCVDKGFSFRDTVIGSHSKIDNLVHIAHSVHTGRNCFVIAGAMLAGSVTLEDDVWIGPHANIAPQVTVGAGAFVTLGAVVTRDVAKNEMVSGVFAIPHKKFLDNLKKSLE
jgi:UDP-3-O-[3-hydroxymyristoyl] glucosamine N-acyltransferase